MATDLKSTTEDVTLTRFWGGEDRGTCVQVTTGWQEHVSLTRVQALQLSRDLAAFALKEEKPDYDS